MAVPNVYAAVTSRQTTVTIVYLYSVVSLLRQYQIEFAAVVEHVRHGKTQPRQHRPCEDDRVEQEDQKKFVVSVAHTVGHPVAVVVHLKVALAAETAVMGTFGLGAVAVKAERESRGLSLAVVRRLL